MKTLKLTLKKKWFDLIKSGIKKEEYREIKRYWETRFAVMLTNKQHYDAIEFKNGYSKNAPKFLIELKGIRIGTGKAEWGAEKGVKYFMLELGEIINEQKL